MGTESLILWAPLPLRIVIGLIFILQGIPKLINPERTATKLLRLKVFQPKLLGILLAMVETFGGLAILIGFSTRIATIILTIVMVIAAYLKRTKMKKTIQIEVMIIIGLIILTIIGAGEFSIDLTFGWLLG